ncbi:MAG: tail fiber domain-containing protein [Melioribacteraceae bacterium]
MTSIKNLKNLVKFIGIGLLLFGKISISYSQVAKDEIKKSSLQNVEKPNSTEATGDFYNFKDSGGYSILKITDEGTTGSITLPTNSTPTIKTDKLYNQSGILKFNNYILGPELDDLSDAKFDGVSLFIGYDAGYQDDGGNDNTSVGLVSLFTNTFGERNSAIGAYTLFQNVWGDNNTAIGYRSLENNKYGLENTATGTLSLTSNMTEEIGSLTFSGDCNTAIGYFSLGANTLGDSNTAISSSSLLNNTTGHGNTAVGFNSQYNNSIGESNTSLGERSLYSNLDGGSNSALGFQTLYNNSSTNTGAGYKVLYSNTSGEQNFSAGYASNFSNTTGNYNVGVGQEVNYYNQTGSNNTIIGTQAGKGNSAHNKNGNVFIGYRTGYNETNNNRLFINNDSSSSPLIWGNFNTNRVVIKGNGNDNDSNRTFFVNGSSGGTGAWFNDSDVRLKTQIETISSALEKVKLIRGVNFEWKDTVNHDKGRQIGFIAQEVNEIIPEIVDDSGNHFSMQYETITAILVEAIKEQQNLLNSIKLKNDLLIDKTNKIFDKAVLYDEFNKYQSDQNTRIEKYSNENLSLLKQIIIIKNVFDQKLTSNKETDFIFN